MARHLEECAECRARLEQETRFRARATDILSAARPHTETVPPFAAVLERARPPRPRWPIPTQMGWAASVVLALGLGWFGRDLVSRQEMQKSARESGPLVPPTTAAPEPLQEPQLSTGTAASADADRAAANRGQQKATAQPRAFDAVTGAVGGVAGAATGAGAVRTEGAVQQAAPPPSVAEQRAQLNAAAPIVAPAPPPAAAPAIAQDLSRSAEAWDSVSIEQAQQRARRPIHRIPELPVTAVAIRQRDSVVVVRVSQRLPGGGIVELIQEASTPARPEAAAFTDRAQAAQRAAAPPPVAREEKMTEMPQFVMKGQTLIRIDVRGATLTADSIRALLHRVR